MIWRILKNCGSFRKKKWGEKQDCGRIGEKNSLNDKEKLDVLSLLASSVDSSLD